MNSDSAVAINVANWIFDSRSENSNTIVHPIQLIKLELIFLILTKLKWYIYLYGFIKNKKFFMIQKFPVNIQKFRAKALSKIQIKRKKGHPDQFRIGNVLAV